MDVQAFAGRLDGLFDGDPAQGRPLDERFDQVAADVTGFTTPAELAVLKAAVDGLPPGEAYLEVGTFKGRSVCGALLDGTERTVVAVENFQEFGMDGAQARQELFDNLAALPSLAPGFRLVDGDCYRVLRDPDVVGEPVGVYFFDGAHTWLAHYLALGVAEHLLADEAVVLVDDATWPVVRRATMAYVGRHRGWDVVRAFDAETDHDPRWANGLLVLRYRRPQGGGRRMHLDVRAMLALQRYVVGPAYTVAWKVVPRSEVLVRLGKRFYGVRSHRVPQR
ncbi:MAG TPA: class I SAM-dependent methyltransferase [Nocardioides sp.]|nr:class I SAM-dependent methyltransferase [Nocardioides sp.]